jgi:outer membrane protein OmpA-like peptidoglycan-associated protein
MLVARTLGGQAALQEGNMRTMSIALLAPVVVLVGTGCATKGFVREQVGQSETRVGEQVGQANRRIDTEARRLDEQVAQVGTHTKQIEEMGGRFTKLETSVDEAGNIARTAQARADDAGTRADEVDKRLTKLWSTRNQRQVVETIHVQFGFDRATLSDEAQTALQALLKEMTDNPELTVDLEGYTDSTGPTVHNDRLSERRVATVRRFLVQNGVDIARINWIGMGELKDGEKAKNRRVTVRLMLPAGDLPSRASAEPTPETLDQQAPPAMDEPAASETPSESK